MFEGSKAGPVISESDCPSLYETVAIYVTSTADACAQSIAALLSHEDEVGSRQVPTVDPFAGRIFQQTDLGLRGAWMEGGIVVIAVGRVAHSIRARGAPRLKLSLHGAVGVAISIPDVVQLAGCRVVVGLGVAGSIGWDHER